MPRKKRIHVPKGFYHVMLRGNYGQVIFSDEAHRLKFLALLAERVKKYHFKVHVYCLMSNHIHLVIQVGEVRLSKIMQSLASAFSWYVNHSLNLKGHLFQGRYKAILVQDEEYLLQLCYYIHNNPVSAKMVDKLNDYEWSSHACYTGQIELPWLTIDYISTLINKYFPANDAYLQFLAGHKDYPYEHRYLELDEAGNLKAIDQLDEDKVIKASDDFALLNLHEIINTICHEMDIEPDVIPSPSLKREVCQVRSMIAYIAHYIANKTFIDIAVYFSMTPNSVSRRMHDHLNDGFIQPHLNRINNALRKTLIEKKQRIVTPYPYRISFFQISLTFRCDCEFNNKVP